MDRLIRVVDSTVLVLTPPHAASLDHNADVEGRIFIFIADKAYPIRAAHACLEEFQRQVRACV